MIPLQNSFSYSRAMLIAVGMMLFAGWCHAQSTGSINGVVKNTKGATGYGTRLLLAWLGNR